MKRIGFILVAFFITISCKAVSLFPFFVDLAGNYNEGPVAQLQPYEVKCLNSAKCNDYKSIKDADVFLDDVLPYSNYPIQRNKIKLNGLNMEVYTSPLLDNRTSVICLIELPNDGLYVTYDEVPGNPFNIE